VNIGMIVRVRLIVWPDSDMQFARGGSNLIARSSPDDQGNRRAALTLAK